jgi:hypothetical protein
MSAMTDYLEGEIIKHIFRTGSFTKPSVLAVALFTSAPNDAGGGTEVSGNGYARATLNPADANWAAPATGDGTTSNVTTITFPNPTATWGTITHFAICDAASAGNRLFHGALQTSKVVNQDDVVSFPAGTLQIIFN